MILIGQGALHQKIKLLKIESQAEKSFDTNFVLHIENFLGLI